MDGYSEAHNDIREVSQELGTAADTLLMLATSFKNVGNIPVSDSLLNISLDMLAMRNRSR